MHIIPRYPRETGIADLIAGRRVLVEDPRETARRLGAAGDSGALLDFQELIEELQERADRLGARVDDLPEGLVSPR